METLIHLLTPYLSPDAQRILDALQPTLTLLTPTRLLWTAYSQPQKIPLTLLSTAYNVFNVVRTLNFSFEGVNGEQGWQALLPFLVGGLAIFFTIRSLMSTFRFATRLAMGFVRYGSFFAVILSILGWFFNGGNTNQPGAGLNHNNLGNQPIAHLASWLTGNQNVGQLGEQLYGAAQDFARSADGNTFGQAEETGNVFGKIFNSIKEAAGESSSGTKKKGSRQSNAKTKVRKDRPNTRSTSAKSASNNGADTANPEDLTEMTQSWVKNTLMKAAGLEGWFGQGKPRTRERTGSGKGTKRGEGRTRGR